MNQKQYAVLGLFAPFVFLTTYILLSTQRAGYSPLTKAISELGAVDAPDPWMWNVFGYVLPGISIALFAIGLRRDILTEQNQSLPFWGICLSGIFMAFSGVFPGDFNDKSSLTMLLHTIVSFGSYMAFLTGAFTYPSVMKESAYWKKAVAPTLLFAWLTILFGAWPLLFPHMPALGQRFVFLFYFCWIGFTAYKLYRYDKHSNHAV